MDEFINKHKLLFDSQYGLRANSSTSLALTESIERISNAIDHKLHSFGVFIDIKQGFDTINYDILINKLERYGIHPPFQICLNHSVLLLDYFHWLYFFLLQFIFFLDFTFLYNQICTFEIKYYFNFNTVRNTGVSIFWWLLSESVTPKNFPWILLKI